MELDEVAVRMRACGWRLHPTRKGTAWLRAVNDGSRSHVLICRGETSAKQPPDDDDEAEASQDAPQRWFVTRHANDGYAFFEVGAPDLDRCLAIWDAIPLLDEKRVLNESYYDSLSVPAMRAKLQML